MPQLTPDPTRKQKAESSAKVVGPWKLGRTIGKGSSGRVKIARHVTTGKLAAVKIVSKHAAAIGSQLSASRAQEERRKISQSLEREIVIMKLIDHPNVLRLYDVWETSNELYLVMEYVEGGELFNYIVQRSCLELPEALHYFRQIISAVNYCHRFNIAHRDLKPENILIDKSRNIKVADFGMAAWEAESILLDTSCGSPHYASPEVVSGEKYHGYTSDIWSCGVILHALLVGRLPFDDEDIRILLEKVKTAEFKMPGNIPDSAKDLLSRMLDKNVETRITMPEILKHPFLLEPSLHAGNGIELSPPNVDDLAAPIPSIGDVDRDVFANLRILWPDTSDKRILAALMNSEKSWEKAVYHLLQQYRSACQVEYNDSAQPKDETADMCYETLKPGSPVSHCKSRKDLVRVKQATFSPDTMHEKNHTTEPSFSESSQSKSAIQNAGSPGVLVEELPASISPPHTGSVQRPAVDPICVPGYSNADLRRSFDQVVEQLDILQSQRLEAPWSQSRNARPDTSPTLEAPPTTPASDKEGGTFTQAFKIASQMKDRGRKEPIELPSVINKENAFPRADRKLSTASVLRKHKQLGNKGAGDKSNKVVLNDSTNRGRVSNQAKKGWLAALHLRPNNYVVLSSEGVIATIDECRRILTKYGLEMDGTPEGGLRCRVRRDRANGKPMQFRVEARVASSAISMSGFKTSVSIILEKGSSSDFRHIHDRLRQDWYYDKAVSRHAEIPVRVGK